MSKLSLNYSKGLPVDDMKVMNNPLFLEVDCMFYVIVNLWIGSSILQANKEISDSNGNCLLELSNCPLSLPKV